MNKNHHYFETNRATWNQRVAIHASSKMYDLEGFKKGKSSLKKYEMNALGHVSGKSLLHLQCHFGQDTLSWSRLGAKCVGIDLSDTAIKLAEELNRELQLKAKFVTCNVLDTSKFVIDQFDIVYTSYGVIGWLPDLKPWAKMIVDRLKPGGVFYIVEFHPMVWMFDYLEQLPVMKYAYHRKEVIHETYDGTYANIDAKIKSEDFSWNHSFSDIINALIKAGLDIVLFNEYDKLFYNGLPGMQKDKNGWWFLDKYKNMIPYTFTLKARENR